MPYTVAKARPLTARRVLIVGSPNSWKTTALLDWPKPLHILSYPGEKGHETIPRGVEGISSYVWEADAAEKTSSTAVVTEVMRLGLEIIGGKYGPCQTFAGDGLQKLYSQILNSVTGGAYFQGEEFEPRLYARSHEQFRFCLDRIMSSTVPFAVFTCWDGKEPDNPDLKSMSPTHVYPNLPGKMAKDIMGEFAVVVYAEVKHPSVAGQGKSEGTWQLLPHGKVWGAAIKAPKAVVERLPVKIPQSFERLEQVLQAAQKE